MKKFTGDIMMWVVAAAVATIIYAAIEAVLP